jgi:replicative DNA helicase
MIQRVILGSILLDYGIHDMVMPLLKPEYFDLKNRYLFEIMSECYRKSEPIDNITLYRKVGKNGKWTALEIAQLTNGIASTANILSYIQDLKTDYVRTQFNRLTGIEIDKMCDPGAEIAEMIGKLSKLQEEQVVGTERTITEIVDQALNEIFTEKKTIGMIGLPTPSGKLNNDSRGLRKGELIILAGRPGMGKTAFALSLVRTCCEAGAKVAYFSMEMRSTELAKRLIRSFTDFEAGAGKISNWKIHLFDRGGIDINFVRSNTRLLRDCQMIVIDYLGLMKVNERVKRAEAIGEVSRALKSFALEADIPVLLLCQLNRESEGRSSTVHRLSDLRESGDIEQDADKVFFITRPGMVGDDKMKDSTDRRIIIQKEKDRNGKAPVIYKLLTDETFTNFYDESEDWCQNDKGNIGHGPDAF